MITWIKAMMPPMPRPAMTRPVMITGIDGARPQIADPTMKRPSAAWTSTFLL